MIGLSATATGLLLVSFSSGTLRFCDLVLLKGCSKSSSASRAFLLMPCGEDDFLAKFIGFFASSASRPNLMTLGLALRNDVVISSTIPFFRNLPT